MKIIFLGALFLWISGCKVNNDEGLAVLPPDTIDGRYSTNHLITLQTLKIDSTITSSSSMQTFGKYQDAFMGTLQAEAYVQYLLSGTNVNFGDPSKLSLDSLELWLFVTSYYGDSSEVAPIYINEINESFTNEQTYYNHSILNTLSNNLSLLHDFKIQLDTSGNFKRRIHKIRLDNALGNKLLFANSNDLQDNSKFREFFKGLKISSGHQNLMVGFDVISDSSRLVLHYSVQEIDTVIKKTYNFFSDFVTAAKFTNYQRTYTGTLYEQVLNTQSQDYGFLSSGSQNQLYIKISTDSIQTTAVNRAVLEIPVDSTAIGSNPKFLPPSLVFLYNADENKKPQVLNMSSASYDAEKKRYSFVITEKINNYLRKIEENHGFIITPVFPGSSVNRAIILGNKLRLKIYSTQLQ